jgi:hypothetical protein
MKMNMKEKQKFELPVIPKDPSHSTRIVKSTGAKRKPFPKKIVRITGNTKTEPNVTDTVKGCSGGCWGCYAAGGQGVRSGGIIFSTPVPQMVLPELLQVDMMSTLQKHPQIEWARNGVFGDPSFDWESATVFAESMAGIGIRAVIISKLWTLPTEEQMARMALSGAVLHFSIIPGYEYPPELLIGNKEQNLITGKLEMLQRYDQMTRIQGDEWSDSIHIRVGSSKWDEERSEGKILQEAQDWFIDFSRSQGWQVLETPWKYEGPRDPRWEFLSQTELKRQISYATGLPGRKKYAGGQYYPPDFNKYRDWNNQEGVIACDTSCDFCPNQCGTMWQQPDYIYEYQQMMVDGKVAATPQALIDWLKP